MNNKYVVSMGIQFITLIMIKRIVIQII